MMVLLVYISNQVQEALSRLLLAAGHSGLLTVWIWMIMLALIPVTYAMPAGENPFPDITFKEFSQFIGQHFSSKISLSSVLVILFSLTENPDLLNLHARQQYVHCVGENQIALSGWMKGLARAIKQSIDQNQRKPLKMKNVAKGIEEEEEITAFSFKLDALAKHLDLHPYNEQGQLEGKLLPVSHKLIQPVHVLCPNSMECETANCNSRSLLQSTRTRDIPQVTLIKNSVIYDDVFVFTGECPTCKTKYLADHERAAEAVESRQYNRVYLNSARYLKIGQSVWVDRAFSRGVLNGMYSFHASASAYTEYWNNSVWKHQSVNFKGITRRHVWQAFVQESIRTIASTYGTDLTLKDGLAIDEVTKEAFEHLGQNGIILPARGHRCSECTHPYKRTSDLRASDDPAATLGVDEDHDVPALQNINTSLRQSSPAESERMDVDNPTPRDVTMCVIDGIVFGPPHCAYDNCTTELANARGGVFCALHEQEHGATCHVRGCVNQKVARTKACQEHQAIWKRYLSNHGRKQLSGFRRMLRGFGENRAWHPATESSAQPHDQPAPEVQYATYFTPRRFYCVETICAPCGVVIAWAKFAYAEGPSNIMQFLETVYPTEESRPDYICIDKACVVLSHSITSGSWERWSKTSRFIVDAYHYINHRVTDYLCRAWCNPAPLDGSAPNLVILDYDKRGQPYYKRAFNTQACEQLNAWLGGFESIMRKMTVGNFNWFLHTMLFYHTQKVLEKQEKQEDSSDDDSSDDSTDESD
jgi:hypothetical protein